MELTSSQKLALDAAVANGDNLFITGKAGTGKSFVIELIKEELLRIGKGVVCLGTTGISAINISGQTIHSFFKLPIFGVLDYENTNFVKSETRRLFDMAEVIIIDECSMLRPDQLDGIDITLQKNRCAGLLQKQIIFVGDMAQLQPVMDSKFRSKLLEHYENEFFFNAKIYNSLGVREILLEEVVRQDDAEFIENLNIIRDGGKSEYFKQFVKNKKLGIILAPHKDTVEKYNIDGLESLDGFEYIFKAIYEGKGVRPDDFNVDETIKVKDGAKIMYLKNDPTKMLVNGTLGIFRVIDNEYFIEVDSHNYKIDIAEFDKKEYFLNKHNEFELRTVGSIKQYPIRLAYALTIHKSQGLTFDNVTIDLSKRCFAKGQLYVALSRVRSPNGLSIIV